MKACRNTFITILLTFIIFPHTTPYAMGSNSTASWFRFDQVMTSQEEKDTGIIRLKKDEKKKLEEWVSQWSSRLIETAANRGTLNYSGITYSFFIEDIADKGRYITLDNHARWEVAPPDRTAAWYWNIKERASLVMGSNLDYPKKLMRDNGTSIDVRFVSQPSSMQTTHAVSKVMPTGNYVQLVDESVWEIAFVDQSQTALWLANDSVTITPNGDFLYPYSLINNASAQNGKKSVSAKYIGSPATGETRIANVISNGAIIQLANNTFWEIHQDDHSVVWTWQNNDAASIVMSGDRYHPFLIINSRYGQSVLAKILDRPIIVDRTVGDVYIFGALLKLDDGSMWDIPAEYQKKVWLWSPGDRISIKSLSGNLYRIINTSHSSDMIEALYLGIQ